MDGGPLRCWVMMGTPARVLHTWASLTGAPALPPAWALGHHHARRGSGSEQEVRGVVSGYQERGLPLDAVHLDNDHYDAHQVFTVDRDRFPKLPVLAEELRRDGIRLVSVVDPAVRAEPGNAVYDAGSAQDAFVRDAAGRVVEGVVWPGESVYPDFTHARVRKWWGGLYEERLAQGFAGFWHDLNEPVSFTAFGENTLPGRPGTFWRAAAATTGRPTTCTPWAWPAPGTRGCGNCPPGEALHLLALRLERNAALRRGVVRRRDHRLARSARVPVAGDRPGSVRGALLRTGCGRFRRESVAGAVSAVVPARFVPSPVPYPCGPAGGAQGALGVRRGRPRARARGARRTAAAAAVLHDAGASGAPYGSALCAARVVGRARGPGAARLRGRLPAR
ncbi:hypothetical protein SAV31267_019580 [Streptomyces avermitilis]|uniref:Glycoside hydrolase family 31 TIM barrel domain-containing protein n=1 Tax=Streptomyces avermitilis TaxID=33903 RepID=A0A4D4MK46_STRAX|nr:hypothetical protein SAV31267_019580 [Streptomyces avermitilis]